jgi:hypothetical protein
MGNKKVENKRKGEKDKRSTASLHTPKIKD